MSFSVGGMPNARKIKERERAEADWRVEGNSSTYQEDKQTFADNVTTNGTTRGLLATDHVILNHGQVTWTTPELAPPSPNYHTTPTGGSFSSRQI
ncbi:hypothetical protein TNCV_3405241 [Trichonephila clavipes]|nr:hypothetical protein TNCV_3405241 [Trichonephila clavipes]